VYQRNSKTRGEIGAPERERRKIKRPSKKRKLVKNKHAAGEPEKRLGIKGGSKTLRKGRRTERGIV